MINSSGRQYREGKGSGEKTGAMFNLEDKYDWRSGWWRSLQLEVAWQGWGLKREPHETSIARPNGQGQRDVCWESNQILPPLWKTKIRVFTVPSGSVWKGGGRPKDNIILFWLLNGWVSSAWGFISQMWCSASFDRLSKLPEVRCKLIAYLTESQALLSWSFSTPKRVHHLCLCQSPDPWPYNFRYASHVKRAIRTIE